MVMLKAGEKLILQEKASIEGGGSGILTLTNARIVLERQEGLLSKKFITAFSTPLESIHNVWTEGMVMKKLSIELSWSRGPNMPSQISKWKFGVSSPQQWETTIKSAMQQAM